MIYSLNGKLIDVSPTHAVIECGGVGYKCSITLKTAAALGKVGETHFYTPICRLGKMRLIYLVFIHQMK